MKSLLARGGAALLIAATALTAACSNNDPMAPSASTGVNAARATSSIGGPVHANGYVVAWGRDSSTSGTKPQGSIPGVTTGGPDMGGALPTNGYVVAWGRDGSDVAP